MSMEPGMTGAPATDPRRIAPRQDLDDSFGGLLQSPLRRQLELIGELSERAEIVAAVSPEVLTTRLRDGLSSALDRYGHALAPETSNLLGKWLEQHIKLAEALNPRWRALSGGSPVSGFIRGAKVGLLSEEAKVGSALGSLFGGVGGVIGGVVGGLLALQHEERDFAEELKIYLGEVDRWSAVVAGDFERRVLPRIERDLNPLRHRIRWVVAAFLTVAAAGGLAWLLR